MRKLNFIALAFVLITTATQLWGQGQIINIQNREHISLNGQWRYLVDPYETGYYDYRRDIRDQKESPSKSEALFLGYRQQDPTERVEYDFDLADTIQVPGDWNSQKERLFYYEGSVWYYKRFDYPLDLHERRQFVHFGAVNYEADVYLNGKKIGKHEGGFTPFNFEITGKLQESDNFLILKVDNARGLEKVPTINTDWWNYGGITRDVSIVSVPENFIRDYYIQLSPKSQSEIEIWVQLDGSQPGDRAVEVSIPELNENIILLTNEIGRAQGVIKNKTIQNWSPTSPKLYGVELQLGNYRLKDQIGFRTLKVEGADILLNDQPVFLRGISIHEENGVRGGRAYSREDAQMLLGWAKDLGCNFVRLAHYPHNEHMVRVAEELGIMVWSEVPVYWTIQWENEATFKNAGQQVIDMVTRDKNRAAVIVWSMANETPVSEARTSFLKKQIDMTRAMDPVRLVSAALERHTKEGTENTQVIGDPLQEYVDIIAFNEYIGWYDGLPEKCKTAVFDIRFNKPIIISEFGAGALKGNYGDKATRWTEEYQEYLYQETLKMLETIPQLRGMTPWILADFRSPRRVLTNIQDGWNRKGVLSELGEKKKAYHVLQEYYESKNEEYNNK